MYRLIMFALLIFWIQTVSADTLVLKNGKTITGHIISETSATIFLRDTEGVVRGIEKESVDLEKTKAANQLQTQSTPKKKEAPKDVQKPDKCVPPAPFANMKAVENKLKSQIPNNQIADLLFKDDPMSRWENCLERIGALYRTNKYPVLARCIDLIEVCPDKRGGAGCCPAACITQFKQLIAKGMDEEEASRQSFEAGDCVEGYADQIAPIKHLEAESEFRSAAANGDVQKLNKLAKSGVNMNAAGNDGNTAFTAAILNRNTECVKALISLKANINQFDGHGETPLMKASLSGRLEIVRLLIDANADLNAGTKYGKTALMFAIDQRHVEIIQTLIEAGADINARDSVGQTALIRARYLKGTNAKEIVRLLEQAGAKE
jgi:hypothetical protein